jgi:hypothetical protein
VIFFDLDLTTIPTKAIHNPILAIRDLSDGFRCSGSDREVGAMGDEVVGVG